MQSFFEVGAMKLLRLPFSDGVINEIFQEDCYHLSDIPEGSLVFDVGAFYGEFGIYCVMNKGCKVMAYEPASQNFLMAKLNLTLNNISEDDLILNKSAITGDIFYKVMDFKERHPAGSEVRTEGAGEIVQCLTLHEEIVKGKSIFGDRKIFVKLDCESSEKGIFKDLKWLELVDILVMEWHNHDGKYFQDILEANGFSTVLEAGGPKPKPVMNNTIAGGLLFAKRKG